MRRTVLVFWSCALLVWASGCDPDPNPDADVATDARRDVRTDDADADGAEGTCSYQSDCGEDEICVESKCETAPKCGAAHEWSDCVEDVGEIASGYGQRAYCDGSRCRIGCMLDQDCPDGEICTDFGSCRSFDGKLDAPPPGGDSRAKLRAGYGETLLDFPIGLSLGGYGDRGATNNGRYVESLRDTHGQMHGLYARAIALDNGARTLVFVRAPIIFSTSALHEAVARRLQDETGDNWRGSLVLSATHTHSGPARFYHIPRETFWTLGSLGSGEYHDQVFRWLADSIAAAARRSLDDLGPAQLGTKIVEGFDTDDAIASDRRGETPDFDDNRLLLMRIDDDSGTPRAVGISFGVHGTIHTDDFFTGDSIAGVERGLERALAEQYGRHVPVLFFNQNGGTMSPRGGGRGHDGPQRFAKLGHEFASRTIGEVDSITTDRSLELDGVTYRFPITYERVGYSDGEWGPSGVDTSERTYRHGAFQCLGGEGDDDFTTFVSPDKLDCAAIQRLLYHRPPTLFLRSQISAFRLGDLRIVTAPGELSMELSWRMIRRLREEYGLDPAATWTLGFAQDHQFYLNPDRMESGLVDFPGFEGTEPKDAPERAYSYLQGGYEANMSFWGWKFGDYLTERVVDAFARLEKNDVERKLPEVLPTQYSPYGQSDFPVNETDSAEVGTNVEQPPSTVERFEAVEFAWKGGDPGAERPQAPRVALQRKTQSGFQTIQTDSARPYTNREPVMLTRLLWEEDDWKKNDSWTWVVRWEEGRDLPTGTYRFAVEGSYKSSSGIESYETQSDAFDVVASDDLAVAGAGASGTVEGTIGYPAGEKIDFGDLADAPPGSGTGNFRLRDPRVPTGAPAPLAVGDELTASDVEIVFEDNGSQVETLTGSDLSIAETKRDRGGESDVPTTTFSASAPSSLDSGTTYSVTVRATDTYGNTGETTFTYQPSN